MINFAATFPILTKNAEVLVPIIDHMISQAEHWLGPAFDPPVVESVVIVENSRMSCVRWLQGRWRARVELAARVCADHRCFAFELAHECIHLIAPGRYPTNRCATNLEEGLAVEFSMRYTAAWFGADGWLFANEAKLRWEYLAAWSAVRRLLGDDDAIIQRMRERQPVISYISTELIREFAPRCRPGDARFLGRPFVGQDKSGA